MLINLRNALMAGKRLPYDNEIEFLESTGTQWIDTGVVWDSVTTAKIEATLQYTQTSGRQIACGAGTAFYFGCNANRWEWAYNRYTGTVGTDVHTVAKEITATATNFYVDGALAATLAGSAAQAWWGSTAYVFGLNNGGSFILPSTARLYSLKIWISGSLVFDGIPVRKGTVGYLYDRVSRKLFGNAGTGDFVLGQDVVPVEYIESHGTEYINLGIVPTDSTGFWVDVATTKKSGQTNTRIFGVHEGNTRCGAALYGAAEPSGNDAFFGWNAATGFKATVPSHFTVSLNYLNDRAAKFNGVTVLSNLGTLGTLTQSAYLLNMNYNNAPFAGQYVIGKLYSAKVSNGSVLSRNTIPVRVGAGSTWEGAMMDVLTRRIYRNQGTGAFTYGNDLKYPIPAE